MGYVAYQCRVNVEGGVEPRWMKTAKPVIGILLARCFKIISRVQIRAMSDMPMTAGQRIMKHDPDVGNCIDIGMVTICKRVIVKLS